MKNFITQLFRFIIGTLFIISGYTKLIDPLGSKYKFVEYFEVLHLDFLVPAAFPFSIFLIMVEIMLGVMLLVGFKSKFTTWSLFLLLLMFLFLTFYSAYTGTVTDCGCFGDAIKLTAWQTFYKNVGFIILIIWLLKKHDDIRPIYSRKLSGALSFLALLVFGYIGYYVLHHLPLIDFRPYAVGKNIPSQMIYPEGAKEDKFKMTFIYKVNGENKEFLEEDKPWKIEGAEYVDRKTVLVEKGYEPPIHDFTMEKNGRDLTPQLMKLEKLMLIISYNLEKANDKGFDNIKLITDKALNNGYTVYLLTASTQEKFNEIKKIHQLDFDMLFCDETTLKTIIRSNPGIVTINEGTIEGKWSYNDFEEVKIKEGMGRKVAVDFALKASLDSIFKLDQKYRSIINTKNPKERELLLKKFHISDDSIGTDFWDKQTQIDLSSIAFLDKIIKEYGYPGRSLVGEVSKDAAAELIIHSNTIDKYIDVVKDAAEKNEITYTKVAEMEDILLVNQQKEQLYGTQTTTLHGEDIIWPIKNFETLRYRREKAGFDLTIYEYAKKLFGKDYVFKNHSLDEVLNIKME